MARRPRISFFIDQCVADAVGRALEEVGHDVTRLRDCMAINSADHVIAVACSRSGQVLVTHDHDFRAIAKRLGISQREHREILHRIDLQCPEPLAEHRIREAMKLIESEWRLAVKAGRQLRIDLKDQTIRTWR